jgi:hypothetical protein
MFPDLETNDEDAVGVTPGMSLADDEERKEHSLKGETTR